MENKVQETGKHQTVGLSTISKPTELQELQIASGGQELSVSSNDEIRGVLKIIFAFIGINEKLIPVGLPKELLIAFIRERINQCTLIELRLAFEYAVMQRFEIDLKLFGETFSPKTVISVVGAFKKYRAKIESQNSEGVKMINLERGNKVLENLNPELVDHIKKIGKADKPTTKKLDYSHYQNIAKEDPFQEYLREFDKLHFDKGKVVLGIKFINYAGLEMDMNYYCKYRAKEVIPMTYEYLRSLKLDQLEFEKQVFFG